MSVILLWVTDAAYYLLCAVLSPLLAWKILARDKYRKHFAERFGAIPRREPKGKPVIWVHAVSVGEVVAAKPLVTALAQRLPDFDIAISATTKTGRETAASVFADRATFQFPLDFSWAVGRSLRRLKPAAVVLMELEVWPNFVRQCRRYGVPVIVANGRISERSCRSYVRFRPVLGWMFRGLRLALAQSDAYAERFALVGVEKPRIRVVGTVKYDGVSTNAALAAAHRTEQRALIGASETDFVIVAGSTHPPEHEAVIRAWQSLRRDGIPARLVLVPRHPDKPEPLRFMEREAVPHVRQSVLGHAAPPPDAVIFGDVMGTLGNLYAAADAAFVGKSLITDGGGQNPIEPAALGVPTIVGPHMQNFRAVIDDLSHHAAIVKIATGDDLAPTLRELIADEGRRRTLGENARRAVELGKGSAARSAAAIAEVLGV